MIPKYKKDLSSKLPHIHCREMQSSFTSGKIQKESFHLRGPAVIELFSGRIAQK